MAGDPLPQGREATGAEDQRVQRTRLLTSQALIELALERPFESITVRDITERARIGYATFFRHYAGKEELLRSMLQELLAELVELVLPFARSDPAAAGTVVFRHAQAKADLYRLLIRTGQSTDLLGEAVRVGVDSIRQTYRERQGTTVPFEVAADFLVRSFVNLIDWWLEHDQPYSPEKMGEIYDQLVRKPLERTALEPRERSG